MLPLVLGHVDEFGRLADESYDLKPVQPTRFRGSCIRQVGGVKGVEVDCNVHGALRLTEGFEDFGLPSVILSMSAVIACEETALLDKRQFGSVHAPDPHLH